MEKRTTLLESCVSGLRNSTNRARFAKIQAGSKLMKEVKTSSKGASSTRSICRQGKQGHDAKSVVFIFRSSSYHTSEENKPMLLESVLLQANLFSLVLMLTLGRGFALQYKAMDVTQGG